MLNEKTWTDIFEYSIPNIKVHGKTNQIIKAAEELNELEQEMFNALTGRTDREKIIEETADVLVMLAQIKTMFNITSAELESWAKYKMDRERKKWG